MFATGNAHYRELGGAAFSLSCRSADEILAWLKVAALAALK